MQISWWIDVRGVIAAVKKCIDFSWNNINSNQFTLLLQPACRECLLPLSVPVWSCRYRKKRNGNICPRSSHAFACVKGKEQKKERVSHTFPETTQRVWLSLVSKEKIVVTHRHTQTQSHREKRRIKSDKREKGPASVPLSAKRSEHYLSICRLGGGSDERKG